MSSGIGRSRAELEVPRPRPGEATTDKISQHGTSTTGGESRGHDGPRATGAATTVITAPITAPITAAATVPLMSGAGRWEGTTALAALTTRHPCPPATAAAILDLINEKHAPVSDWSRFIQAFSPADLTAWHARAQPTPIPPDVHEVLAAQQLLAVPPSDVDQNGGRHDDASDGQDDPDHAGLYPEFDTEPGAGARAALRARKGWTKSPVRTNG